VIKDFRAKQGVTPREITDQEIFERTVYPMINEGAKILEEGKAIRASDIDIVWLNGYGWPAYRGGPMYYANTVGLKTVADKMKEFEAKYGADFTPSALLLKLADEGKTFADL
jgi:3-hydroxyacyl-CoA dehydrogenase